MPELNDIISPRRVSPSAAGSNPETGSRAQRAAFRSESDGHASAPRAGALNRLRSALRRCEPPSPGGTGALDVVPGAHAPSVRHGLKSDLRRRRRARVLLEHAGSCALIAAFLSAALLDWPAELAALLRAVLS